MDYEEEVVGEDDDVISDEDEEIEGMEGLPGDIGLNVEVVLNDDEDGMGSDDDEDDSEEGEDDDEMEGEDLEIVEEVDDDDPNDSGNEGEDWQSDEDDGGAYDEEEVEMMEDEEQQDDPGHLAHIVRALENGDDMLPHLEGGDLRMDLDPDSYMEEALQDEEGRSTWKPPVECCRRTRS
jgi:E3 ubiquitin-protein ligase HUWE1